MTTSSRQPCGRENCCQRYDFSPRFELAATPSVEELAAGPHATEEIERWYAEVDKHVAWHEAGHCVAAVAAGVGIDHVRCGQRAGHCAYAGTFPDAQSSLVAALAGPVAEGLSRGAFPVSYHAAPAYVGKAKEGSSGDCDGCQVARVLVQANWSDADTIAYFRTLWTRTVALFDRIEVRIAVANVAEALRRERLLSGDQVNALVSADALREAAREAMQTSK
jgi:hypothetical protein